MPSNCGIGEDAWESLGQQGDQINQPKGYQPWIFIERTGAEAEALIDWPPEPKSQFTGKDTDAGKDWGQEEKGTSEDEMVEWHRWLNRDEFEKTRRHWRTGKPGMRLQRVGQDLVTE